MKIGIMQPYFFPYIGYYQLMNAVDEYVVYDNIKYTKKGWINRNRILVNGKDEFISLPLKKDSDYLDIVQRELSDTWPQDRKKMLNRITESYRKAPYFEQVFPLVEKVIMHEDTNLFRFLLHSLELVNEYLGIDTKLVISSELPIDHGLRAEEKVLALCKARNATTYINPIGGVELYNKDTFSESGTELFFLKSDPLVYPQFTNEFVPWLSIIDVMMFMKQSLIREYLKVNYTLV